MLWVSSAKERFFNLDLKRINWSNNKVRSQRLYFQIRLSINVIINEWAINQNNLSKEWPTRIQNKESNLLKRRNIILLNFTNTSIHLFFSWNKSKKRCLLHISIAIQVNLGINYLSNTLVNILIVVINNIIC